MGDKGIGKGRCGGRDLRCGLRDKAVESDFLSVLSMLAKGLKGKGLDQSTANRGKEAGKTGNGGKLPGFRASF
jgi:hypothetical protein